MERICDGSKISCMGLWGVVKDGLGLGRAQVLVCLSLIALLLPSHHDDHSSLVTTFMM